MNIYGIKHIVQNSGCQHLQVQVLLCLSYKPINILRLIFLILYLVFKRFNLGFQVCLLLLIIIRQHLKASFVQFSVGNIHPNVVTARSITSAFYSLWCAYIVASLRRRTYLIRTFIQLLDVEKQKEPITQSIRNWRDYSSRFKVKFYVIVSENSKSCSAFYSSRQQNQRRCGAVRHFRCTDNVSYETDLWWNIGIQLCHHYTDTSLIRQVSECLSLFSEFQRAIFNGSRKRSLYWLGHLGVIYQRVLENNLHIPPEKTFIFVPCTEEFPFKW